MSTFEHVIFFKTQFLFFQTLLGGKYEKECVSLLLPKEGRKRCTDRLPVMHKGGGGSEKFKRSEHGTSWICGETGKLVEKQNTKLT